MHFYITHFLVINSSCHFLPTTCCFLLWAPPLAEPRLPSRRQKKTNLAKTRTSVLSESRTSFSQNKASLSRPGCTQTDLLSRSPLHQLCPSTFNLRLAPVQLFFSPHLGQKIPPPSSPSSSSSPAPQGCGKTAALFSPIHQTAARFRWPWGTNFNNNFQLASRNSRIFRVRTVLERLSKNPG